MENKPDFFLSAAGEMIGEMAAPRACFARGRLRDEYRDDYMLVEIDPPLVGQKYGLGDQDVTILVLSTRQRGATLFPIGAWPCHVYIARVLDDAVLRQPAFCGDQVALIGWGTIFPSAGWANVKQEDPRHVR